MAVIEGLVVRQWRGSAGRFIHGARQYTKSSLQAIDYFQFNIPFLPLQTLTYNSLDITI